MKQVLGISLGIGGVLIMLMAGLRLILGGVFDGLASAKIADLMTLVFIMFIFGALVITVFVAILWRVRQNPAPAQRDDAIEDASWRRLSMAQQPQLGAPMMLTPGFNRVNVPISYSNGALSGAQPLTLLSSSVDSEDGRVELTCSVKVLRVAMQILSAGDQPTRTAFNGLGINSSTEIRAAVEFLRAHGYIAPAAAAGSPARWSPGADAAHLAQMIEAYA